MIMNPNRRCFSIFALAWKAICLALVCCCLLFSVPANAQSGETGNGVRKPANFAILVDTSGSMVALYQRRDPRPTLVMELVQSLITETMQPGDRLVVLPFDHQVHNTPGEFVAISSLAPGTALKQVEKLNLQPQSGEGTARTAALGAGAQALEALARPTDSGTIAKDAFSGGVVYIVTDADNDRAPDDGAAKAIYDQAQNLQKSGNLNQLARIPQSGIILEMWQLKGRPGTPEPASPVAVISKVKQLLKNVLPQRPLTSGPLKADFEGGSLTMQSLAPEWKEDKDGGFELPVSVTSKYKVLNFRGAVEPNLELQGTNGQGGGKLSLTFKETPVVLSPGGTADAILRMSDVPRPGLLSLSSSQFQIIGEATAAGVGTTQPALFKVADPAATARVSEAIWVDPWKPPLIMGAKLPQPPPLSPPRGLQALLALLALGLVAGAWKAFGPKPVPALTLHYHVEGEGASKIVALSGKDSSFPLVGVSATAYRQGVTQTIVLRPGANAVLLDSNRMERAELVFTDASRFFVKGADGKLTAVNLDFGKNPPRPEPAVQDDLPMPDANNASSNQPKRSGDDWGLG